VLKGAKMNVEQRSTIKYWVRNQLSKKKTIEQISKIYWKAGLKKTAIYKWYKRFQEGRET
jgi:hypothetical protein